MQGGQTKQGELFIALTHEDHKPIIFDRVLKAGNSVLLAAKMVIKNPEEVNAAIVNGKQSKEYFHRVTGHAGHHLMDATAKYYKVDLTGKVNNCLSCSLEKIRQKNIPKKNQDKTKNSGERMYLDISSMRKTSMGGRQHWVMLVDEATKYKKSFFLKKKNEQVEPIIDWIKALKARHKIQGKIIRCDNAGENKVLERESDKIDLGIIFSTAWNSNMNQQFSPGYVNCLDESMSVWTNQLTCPGFMFVPRKPWPFGNEYHSVCCCLSGIMWGIDLVEGKD